MSVERYIKTGLSQVSAGWKAADWGARTDYLGRAVKRASLLTLELPLRMAAIPFGYFFYRNEQKKNVQRTEKIKAIQLEADLEKDKDKQAELRMKENRLQKKIDLTKSIPCIFAANLVVMPLQCANAWLEVLINPILKSEIGTGKLGVMGSKIAAGIILKARGLYHNLVKKDFKTFVMKHNNPIVIDSMGYQKNDRKIKQWSFQFFINYSFWHQATINFKASCADSKYDSAKIMLSQKGKMLRKTTLLDPIKFEEKKRKETTAFNHKYKIVI